MGMEESSKRYDYIPLLPYHRPRPVSVHCILGMRIRLGSDGRQILSIGLMKVGRAKFDQFESK